MKSKDASTYSSMRLMPTDSYLGCYQVYSPRILSTEVGTTINDNTPEGCVFDCAQLGFTYSGVQAGSQCWCGEEKPEDEVRRSEINCASACSGDPAKTCGGSNTIAVYQTKEEQGECLRVVVNKCMCWCPQPQVNVQ